MAAFWNFQRGDTVAQLKDDIDSGLTGDKNIAPDPGMASLGTCDEAAGTSPTPERVALARKQEREIGRIATADDRLEGHAPMLVLIGVMATVVVAILTFYFGR